MLLICYYQSCKIIVYYCITAIYILWDNSLIPQPNIFAEECATSQADMNLYCRLENNQNEG